jgi:hypothetical protein
MARDLFDIFPDLPWARRHAAFEAHDVVGVRLRAEAARARMAVEIGRRQRMARAIREAWRQHFAPGRRGRA